MADPELDLDDAHLARALDELARLADEPVQKFVPLKTSQSEPDENEAENQIPQPLLEPIPIEVPLPPTPVMIQPPMNAALAAPSENGAANDRSLLAELTALSAGDPADKLVNAKSTDSRSSLSGRLANDSPFMVSMVVVVMFLAGMLTERFIRVLEKLRLPDVAATDNSKNRPFENELTGRIIYKTKEGESRPDRGARIIVFPQKRAGEVKLPVIGFRPADDAADQLVANAALKPLGGAATTVDADGGFRLSLEPGSYQVLVLSHFQPRDESADDPTLNTLLSAYFDKPEELLGRVQHQFSPLRIKGTGEVWDHSF